MSAKKEPKEETPEALALRQDCGAWLRSLRERAGLSQRELAALVGLEYHSFISQIETGRARLPSGHVCEWANAVRIPQREFALRLLSYYEPVFYRLLHDEGEPATPENDRADATLIERVMRIEDLLKRHLG